MSCTKLQLPPEPLTRGLPPPDPHSLCPLSSTEFVEPPLKKIPGYATELLLCAFTKHAVTSPEFKTVLK